jgi:hypothetical protein
MNTTTGVFRSSVIPTRERRESIIERHPVTGIVSFEEFRVNSKLDRTDGPACIWRDEKTGLVIAEEWYTKGRLDRRDGPARIHRDAQTGCVTREQWWKNGEQVEPSAVIKPGAGTEAPNNPAMR